MAKILICGYIGGGNVGDEAVCDRLVAAIRRQGDRPLLLSLAPAESQAIHGVPVYPRTPWGIIRALADCDLLLLGGGTLLQAQSSCRSPLFYLAIAALAEAMGKPFVLVGGIDPLPDVIARLARSILPGARALFLRDGDSLARGRALAPAVPGFFMPDSAWLPLGGTAASAGRPRRPYRVICPKSGVKAVDLIPLHGAARRRGEGVVYLALTRADLPLCRVLAARLGGVCIDPFAPAASCGRQISAYSLLPHLPPFSRHLYFAAPPCEIACRILASATAVYSARLHGLLFAAKAGIPARPLPDGTPQHKFTAFFVGRGFHSGPQR